MPGGDFSQHRRRHDAVEHNRSFDLAVTEDELCQEDPHLIAGELAVVTVWLGQRDGESIGVRVVGKNQVGIDRSRQLVRPVHRPRLLGIGERHGRKPPVRLELRRHRMHAAEPEPL